jgi:hypothetical protein
MASPVLLVLALIIVFLFFAISILHWVWNTTLVKAVDWARPISHWDAFKLLLLVLLILGGFHINFGGIHINLDH